MHYLQNSWFETNWMWVIAVMVLSVSVVSYINNKTGLLKKSLVTLSVTFVVAICTTVLFSSGFSSLPTSNMNLHNSTSETAQVETGSVFSQLTTYIFNIVSDKVSE